MILKHTFAGYEMMMMIGDNDYKRTQTIEEKNFCYKIVWNDQHVCDSE